MLQQLAILKTLLIYSVLFYLHLTSSNCNAQCSGLCIDSIQASQISCSAAKNGSITIYASSSLASLNYSIGQSSGLLFPTDDFSVDNIIHGTSGSTAAWFAPSYNPPLDFNSSGGCPGGFVGYSSGWNNFWSNFLRTPYVNCTGQNEVVMSFDLSNSYVASQTNNRVYFNMWASTASSPGGTYTSATSVNGVPGDELYFDQLRSCQRVNVVFDLSIVTDKSAILFYLNASCGYNNSNVYTVGFDNVSIGPGFIYQSSNTFDGLSAGQYNISILDSSGCIEYYSGNPVIISEPSTLNASLLSHTDVSCYGATDGDIIVSSTGGTPPYQYSISQGTYQSNGVFTNLTAGCYTIVISDSAGCTDTLSGCLTEPSEILSNATISHVSSIGGVDGYIILGTSGGTSPYVYSWSNGSNLSAIVGLSAGVYVVTITDANSCAKIDSITVTEPDPPTCSKVAEVWVSKITPSSARLNWTEVPGAHHYTIRGRRVGNLNWIVLPIPNGLQPYKDISGLNNGLSYEWQIETFCNSSGSLASGFSIVDTFVAFCQAPDSLWTGTTSSNGARLEWTPVTGAVGYKIRGQKIGSSGWVNVLVGAGASYKDVFGLTSNSAYQWRIKAWCDNQGIRNSVYTPLYTFITNPSKLSKTSSKKSSDIDQLLIKHKLGENEIAFTIPDKLLNKQIRIVLSDLNGRVILKTNFRAIQDAHIKLPDLLEGIYFISFYSSEYYQTNKLYISSGK